MSSVNVLDASAILAYLQQERGEELVEAALDESAAWVTTVNSCEVLGKLAEKGMPISEAQGAIDDLGITAIDFDRTLARHAAALRVQTKAIGASLGDRACLALAMRIVESKDEAVVFTAEQGWAKIKWPFKVVVIRSGKAAS